MMHKLGRPLLALTSILPIGHATIYNTRFPGTTWDDENWTLTTTHLDPHHYQSRMSLANGYLGINLAAIGPFFDIDEPVNGDAIQGWPLFDRRQSFATISGFWDYQPHTNGSNFQWLDQYGGESVISGVPHWSGLAVQVGDQRLDANVAAEQIGDFRSNLDVRRGTMSWEYVWSPEEGMEIAVEYEMLVHRLLINQAAVRVRLTSKNSNVNATVVDVLDGDCAVRTTANGKGRTDGDDTIWTSVRPDGISDVEAYVFSTLVGDASCHQGTATLVEDQAIVGGNSSGIAQSIAVSLAEGRTSTIVKYVGAASSDAFDDPRSVAKAASRNGSATGYDALLTSHIAEWEAVMPQDSVDNFRDDHGSLPFDADIQELQITAITNPFQLLQNTISDNAVAAAGNNTRLQSNSISVCGLGASCYAGFVFWDAEVWMQPGLVVSFPQASRQITQYRVNRYHQAQANILTAYQSSQNETGKFSPSGAIFPWTDGRYGNCTGTGPCFDYQYHLNGDIGLEFWNYWTVTGDNDFFRSELFPIYQSVAQMYADLVSFNQTSGLYDLYNATDPDEYANFQNNVGYTMVLMSAHLNNTNSIRQRFGMESNATWANISSHITIPVNYDANIILEYTSQNGSITVKQADIVLIDDFLQFPNPYTLSNLNYYASAQSPDGPAMTYGAFSVVANRESPSGCSSFTYGLYGSQPYTRGPWFQFSEQLIDDASVNGGTHPAFPFLTGVGGANRVTVFGYLGLRLDPDVFDIDPSLPPQILQLEYRTIYWQGWPIKARSNQTHTTLHRLSTPLSEANQTFATAPIPVQISLTGTTVYNLTLNGTLTLANRQIGQNKTLPGNLLQCVSGVTSPDAHEPGQFPLSATDGAASTRWQPSQANTTSSLTVPLGGPPFYPLSHITFDWAQSPPVGYRVSLHNLSDTGAVPPVVIAESEDVRVSVPFDAAEQFVIRPYESNTTEVELGEGVWSARYATLEIWGNRAGNGTGRGATVAEWALISAR